MSTYKSLVSAVGKATGYGLDYLRVVIRETGFGAHPASYAMDTWGFFPWG
jgi:hypothetical protein